MKKKTIIMIFLVVMVCIMATGYAILQQQLNISGTGSIDSTWKIEIIDIDEVDIVGDASSKVAPSYTATTANFDVSLLSPGDSITYEITVKNGGTLDAKVDSHSVEMDENDAIVYEVMGLSDGDLLKAGEESVISVKISFKDSYTGQPERTTSDIKVIVNYVQTID